MVYRMETLSAKLPDHLAQEVENYQEAHGLNRSQAMRRLIEDGLEAERVRNERDDLRDDLDERRARDERTISVPQDLATVAAAWIGLILLIDGLGWITFELQVGTAELGSFLLLTIAGYAVYRRYKAPRA